MNYSKGLIIYRSISLYLRTNEFMLLSFREKNVIVVLFYDMDLLINIHMDIICPLSFKVYRGGMASLVRDRAVNV
jgi:hypothetical protein